MVRQSARAVKHRGKNTSKPAAADRPPDPEPVRLADLTFLPELQCRAGGLDEAHVLDLVEAIEGGAVLTLEARQLPAPDGRTVVTDGHHTGEAYRRCGYETVPVVVRPGDWSQALLDSTAANKQHNALKRTRADVREAIHRTLLACPGWSDHRVAEHVGTSHKTAAVVRRQMEGRGEISHVSHRTDTRGRSQPATKPPPATAGSTPAGPPPAEPDAPPPADPTPTPPANLITPAPADHKHPTRLQLLMEELNRANERKAKIIRQVFELPDADWKAFVAAAGRNGYRIEVKEDCGYRIGEGKAGEVLEREVILPDSVALGRTIGDVLSAVHGGGLRGDDQ